MAKKPVMKKDDKMAKDKMPMAKAKDKAPATGLTPAQKKLPPALQAAMLKKMKK
jgi:hypothetical protein